MWVLIVIFVVTGACWLGLQLELWPAQRRASERADSKDMAQVSQHLSESLRQRSSQAQVVRRSARPLPDYELSDVTATIHASDMRYSVTYAGGIPIGTITPHKGRFEASHVRAGELGA